MPTVKQISQAFDELRKESNDRAAAIVGATLVEMGLDEAILSRLLPLSNNIRDALFRDDQGYTFSSKIDLGFALGLYGQKARTDLHRIKRIRNEFAHNLDRSFESAEIIKICRDLTDYRSGEPLREDILEQTGTLRSYVEGREIRWRYVFAILRMGQALERETRIRHQPPLPTELTE